MNRRVFGAGILAAVVAMPQSDPPRTLWINLKRHLTAPDGDKYFEEGVKDAEVPFLTGALTSSLLNDGISKLVTGIEDPETPDATLVLHHAEHRVKGPLRKGARVTFEGVARSFTREPFMLTFDVSMGRIKGVEFERLK